MDTAQVTETGTARPIIGLGVEQHSVDWIPEPERHGKIWHQPLFWFMGNFQLTSIAIGFVGPSLGLSVLWTFVAALCGLLVGTFFMAFHASQGPRMGLPQMIQSRAQFGHRGLILPLIAVFITYIGFCVLNQLILATGVHSGFGINALGVAIVVTLLAALLIFYGHDWLHRVFRWGFYVSVPLLLVLSIAALTGNDGPVAHAKDHYGFNGLGFMGLLAIAVAYNVTYAVYVSDYTRYMPSRTSSGRIIGSVYSGALGSAVWLMPLGAWYAIRLGANNPVVALQVSGNHLIVGFGTAVAVVLILVTITNTGLNGYGAMMTLLTGVDSFREFAKTHRARAIAVAVAAITWFLVAELLPSHLVTDLTTILTVMLYVLIPWTATNLMDYFIVRRGHYAITDIFRVDGIYGRWGTGLISFCIGIAAEIPFMTLGPPFNYMGPGASAVSGVDIAWAVGLAVTGIAYAIQSHFMDLSKEWPAIEASDAELERVNAAADRSRPLVLEPSGTPHS